MTKEQIQERLNNALEAELSKIYDELEIQTGDIAPLDSIEWDRITEEATELFQRLIDWNTEGRE